MIVAKAEISHWASVVNKAESHAKTKPMGFTIRPYNILMSRPTGELQLNPKGSTPVSLKGILETRPKGRFDNMLTTLE